MDCLVSDCEIYHDTALTYTGSLTMTVDNSAEVRQQRVREFMQMLPLTIELAGLPLCEAGRMFTQDQLDLRGTHIRNAYKLARQIVKDVSEG